MVSCFKINFFLEWILELILNRFLTLAFYGYRDIIEEQLYFKKLNLRLKISFNFVSGNFTSSL